MFAAALDKIVNYQAAICIIVIIILMRHLGRMIITDSLLTD